MDEDEVYSTHMQDQIEAAQAEQEAQFLKRAHEMGVDDPIMLPDGVFEDSYFSSILPWLVDFDLRDQLIGCQHVTSPQPLWVFFDNPIYLQCEECADIVHTYKTIRFSEGEAPCEICENFTEVSWSYASYEYFTLAGLICQPCHNEHQTSIGVPPKE